MLGAALVLLLLPNLPANADEPDWGPYAAILSQYVHQGSKLGIALHAVDYRGIRQDDEWSKVLASVADFDLSRLHEREERLAFWINAYNILAINMVLEHWPLHDIRDAGMLFWPVWHRSAGRIGGKMRTLHEIEHRILRPMGDPRIHMAIVCASVSCPDLRIRPYRAAFIEQHLDEQAALFMANSGKGVRIADGGIYISEIFDWFEADFDGPEGVKRFIRLYREDMGAGISVAGHLPYHWQLNGYP